MKKKIYLLGLLALLMLTFSSCAKKIIYFQDMIPGETNQPITQTDLRIRKNDKLSIFIKSKNSELSMPFNLDNYQVSSTGEIIAGRSSANANAGYVVSNEGTINFPVLGKVYVADMTLGGLATYLEEQLIARNMIVDPIVFVELMNFKVTVMGEVGRIGVINDANSQMTLLDAITNAGGLSEYADPANITVIREENGVRKSYTADVQSKEFFDSPVYYLAQNDIIYAKPGTRKGKAREDRAWRYYTTAIGLLGTTLSILILLK